MNELNNAHVRAHHPLVWQSSQIAAKIALVKKLDAAKATLRRELEEKHRQALAAEKRAAEKRAQDEAEKKIAVIAAERDLNASKIKELSAREVAIKKQAQQDADSRVQQEVVRQRQILEKDRDEQLLKKQAEFNREREGYQRKMKEMERQLWYLRRPPNWRWVGDGAEIDLSSRDIAVGCLRDGQDHANR